MKFFTLYDRGVSPSVTFRKPSMTEQQHIRDVDINMIVARFNRTGVLGTPTQVRDMFFGDFSDLDGYHDYQNRISEAKERFLALPSNVRAEFGNDPGKLIDALHDPAQLGRLQDLGIVKKSSPVVGTPDNPGDLSVNLNADQKAQPSSSQTSAT